MEQQNHEQELNELYNKLSIATKDEIIEQANGGNKDAKYFLYKCYKYGFEKLSIEQDQKKSDYWLQNQMNCMNFAKSIKICFKKYFVFKGRASRSEFWWFWLLSVIFNRGFSKMIESPNISTSTYVVISIIWIFLIIPYISVSVRRLHDVGKSGLLLIIPYTLLFLYGFLDGVGVDSIILVLAIISNLWLLYLLIKKSDEDNKYGKAI